MAVIMTGVLMTAVDTTIVVLALPEIQRGLHVALSAVVWVIISFLLVITLLATQVGRLGDMFGRVRMYEMGFAVFVLGSLACALAWNEPSIIAFRVLQGIGGAFIMANSGAVIADLYPRELRGKAYGYTSVGWTMGSSAVMKAAPPEAFGIAAGLLRTFANVGMVFSFAVAILIASRSISRGLAFAIFVGSTSLHGEVADAFTSGLHAAFYASMGFMALAAALSALRQAPPGSSAAGRAARRAGPSAAVPPARRRPRPRPRTACGSRRR